MNAVTTTEANAVQVGTTPSPLAVRSPMDGAVQLLQAGLTTDQLKEMMALQLQWEANEARKAFVEAMARFKQAPPAILKTKLVEHSGISYKHATLADVTTATTQALSEHGISHRWEVDQQGDQIVVSCILTHIRGHSEKTTLRSGADLSGKKNNIQGVASTTSYLSRYTLLMACGLATQDMDDDGHGANAGIDPVEQEVLTDLIKKVKMTKTDEDALKFWKEHSAAFKGNRRAYEEFKDQTAAHRLELQEATKGDE